MPTYSPILRDVQQDKPSTYCDRCGGEIYGRTENVDFGATLCQSCKEALAERDP